MTATIVPSVLDSSLYVPDLRHRRRDSVLAELVDLARSCGVANEPALLLETLLMREKLGTTALGKGVAVPYARSIAVTEPRIVVSRSKRGVDWDAPDGGLVHIVLLVLSPADLPLEAHHEFLGRVTGALRLQRQRQRLIDATGYAQVQAVLREILP